MQAAPSPVPAPTSSFDLPAQKPATLPTKQAGARHDSQPSTSSSTTQTPRNSPEGPPHHALDALDHPDAVQRTPVRSYLLPRQESGTSQAPPEPLSQRTSGEIAVERQASNLSLAERMPSGSAHTRKSRRFGEGAWPDNLSSVLAQDPASAADEASTHNSPKRSRSLRAHLWSPFHAATTVEDVPASAARLAHRRSVEAAPVVPPGADTLPKGVVDPFTRHALELQAEHSAATPQAPHPQPLLEGPASPFANTPIPEQLHSARSVTRSPTGHPFLSHRNKLRSSVSMHARPHLGRDDSAREPEGAVEPHTDIMSGPLSPALMSQQSLAGSQFPAHPEALSTQPATVADFDLLRFKHLRVNTKPQLHTAPGHPKAASSRTALGATLSKRPPSHKVAAKGTKGAPLTGLGDSYFGLESLDLAAQKPMDARERTRQWVLELELPVPTKKLNMRGDSAPTPFPPAPTAPDAQKEARGLRRYMGCLVF